MVAPRVLVVVLAGGEGGRLELLTRHRAKPAVPYAGHYRLVDVVLSNVLHSGLADVWLVEQTHPFSLQDHLANGRPWDLDRTTGGLRLLHPRRGTGKRDGWQEGTADALWRYADLIRGFDPQAMVVLSADAVYALDYEQVVREHLASDAVVTMVTTRVDPGEAGRYGVVQVEGGRVVDYAYEPDEPAGDLVTNEVFVFDPGPTLELLEQIADDQGEEGLADLGEELLPRLVADGRAREHRFDGYWRDLGTVEAYHAAHMDLVADEPPFDPGDAAWPLRTQGGGAAAARVRAGAVVESSLLSGGCDVAGTVRRSVLSRGAVVEAGAEVVDSMLLEDVVVRAGARVVRAVLDHGAEVAPGVTVGGDGDVALVGDGERAEQDLPAGGRLPEEDD
jgi:glucose-1-phosphate adenylyltransferase